MREFFKGWRRKVGCITLVMACALAGLWSRSRTRWDRVELPVAARTHVVMEVCMGGLEFYYQCVDQSIPADMPTSSPFGSQAASPTSDDFRFLPKFAILSVWETRCAPGRVLFGRSLFFRVPILSTTAALTLLSAYLILWKPRQKPKEPQDA